MTDNNPYPSSDPLCIFCGCTFHVYYRYTHQFQNAYPSVDESIEPPPFEPDPGPFDPRVQQNDNWVRRIPNVHAWSDTSEDLMGTGAQSHDPLRLKKHVLSTEIVKEDGYAMRNADINVICNDDWYGRSTRGYCLPISYDKLRSLTRPESSTGKYLASTEVFQTDQLGVKRGDQGTNVPPTFPFWTTIFESLDTYDISDRIFPRLAPDFVCVHRDCLFVIVNSVMGRPLFSPATHDDWAAIGGKNVIDAINSISLEYLGLDKLLRAERKGLLYSDTDAVMGLEFMAVGPMASPEFVENLRFLLLESDRFTAKAASLKVPEAAPAAESDGVMEAFDYLPTEVVTMIVGYLEVGDLRNLEWASVSIRKLLSNSHFWWKWIESNAPWFPELVDLLRQNHDKLDRIDMRKLAGWVMAVSREAQFVNGYGMVLAKRRRILRLSQPIIERIRYLRDVNPPMRETVPYFEVGRWDYDSWSNMRLCGPFSKKALAQKQSFEYMFDFCFLKNGEVREIVINSDPRKPLIGQIVASAADSARFGNDEGRLFVDAEHQFYSVVFRLGISQGQDGQDVLRIMSVLFQLSKGTYRELKVPGVKATHHCFRAFPGFKGDFRDPQPVKTIGMRQTWVTLNDGTDAIMAMEPVQDHAIELGVNSNYRLTEYQMYWNELVGGITGGREPWYHLISIEASLLPRSYDSVPGTDVVGCNAESLIAFDENGNQFGSISQIIGYEREVAVDDKGTVEARYAGIQVTTRLDGVFKTQFLGVTAEQAATWDSRLTHTRILDEDKCANISLLRIMTDCRNVGVVGFEMIFYDSDPLSVGCQTGRRNTLPMGVVRNNIAGFVGTKITKADEPAFLRMVGSPMYWRG